MCFCMVLPQFSVFASGCVLVIAIFSGSGGSLARFSLTRDKRFCSCCLLPMV